MAFKIFKRKKEEEKEEKQEVKKKESSPVAAEEKPAVEEKKITKEEKKPAKKEGRETYKGERIAWRVIKEPHITEKSAILAEQNQYVFKVYPDANKIDIKRAIKEIYGVDVEEVRIIKIPPKKRRRGQIEGIKPGYKKAIVKVKKGQKIEILPK